MTASAEERRELFLVNETDLGRNLMLKTYREYQQLSGLVAPALLLLSLMRPGIAAGQEKNVAPSSKGATQYAEVGICKTCHEDLYKKNFEATPHYKTTLQDGYGCQSCHGPAAEHVEGGGDVTKIVSFTKLSRQEASARCLSCHGEKHEQRHFSSS